MKKVVIVTDGARLRAFRYSERLQNKELSFRCVEIRSADPADPEAGRKEQPAAGLSEIAGQINDIMAEEDPFLWNLGAPPDLLNPLLGQLDQGVRERLTRTVAHNLIETSLTEIALRFPLPPCQPASSAPPARKRRRLTTAPAVEC